MHLSCAKLRFGRLAAWLAAWLRVRTIILLVACYMLILMVLVLRLKLQWTVVSAPLGGLLGLPRLRFEFWRVIRCMMLLRGARVLWLDWRVVNSVVCVRLWGVLMGELHWMSNVQGLGLEAEGVV